MNTPSLLALVISVVGGGTIVPFIYTVVVRQRSKRQEDVKARAEIEGLAAHAAREAVEATGGALKILGQQLKDGKKAEARLEGQCVEYRKTIAELRAELARRPN